jgi:hypothetical protein
VVVCKSSEPQSLSTLRLTVNEPVPRDGPGIAKAKLIGRIRRQVSQAGRSEVISGDDGFWLHRLLEARRVCNPRSAGLLVDGRVGRAKTDWVDVERKTSAQARRPCGGPLVSALAQTPRLD